MALESICLHGGPCDGERFQADVHYLRGNLQMPIRDSDDVLVGYSQVLYQAVDGTCPVHPGSIVFVTR